MYQLLTVLGGLSEKCFQPTGNIFKYFNWLNYLRTDVIKSPTRHKFKEGVFSGEENSSIELAWSGSDLIWSGVAPVRPLLLYYSTGQAEAQSSGALKLNSPFLFSIEFKHTKAGGGRVVVPLERPCLTFILPTEPWTFQKSPDQIRRMYWR